MVSGPGWPHGTAVKSSIPAVRAVVRNCRRNGALGRFAILSRTSGTLRTLTQRAQFVRAARGARQNKRGFSLQMVHSDVEEPRIGYTVTKKTGNSPERNRIKRRLRAAVLTCVTKFEPQHDYVLIGRRVALDMPFAVLVEELVKALTRLQSNRPAAQRT